jgi:predicted nucleic acid-binding protein
MPGFAETSILVRYLTADPPEMAQRAARLIESEEELCVTETILAETAHVLRRLYGVAREDVVDLLVRLLQRRNIRVHGLDKATVITAILLTRPSNRVSIPDALIWAAARCTAPSTVYTFDRRFPREGIGVEEPE